MAEVQSRAFLCVFAIFAPLRETALLFGSSVEVIADLLQIFPGLALL
jgi:hypothetical protein